MSFTTVTGYPTTHFTSALLAHDATIGFAESKGFTLKIRRGTYAKENPAYRQLELVCTREGIQQIESTGLRDRGSERTGCIYRVFVRRKCIARPGSFVWRIVEDTERSQHN